MRSILIHMNNEVFHDVFRTPDVRQLIFDYKNLFLIHNIGEKHAELQEAAAHLMCDANMPVTFLLDKKLINSMKTTIQPTQDLFRMFLLNDVEEYNSDEPYGIYVYNLMRLIGKFYHLNPSLEPIFSACSKIVGIWAYDSNLINNSSAYYRMRGRGMIIPDMKNEIDKSNQRLRIGSKFTSLCYDNQEQLQQLLCETIQCEKDLAMLWKCENEDIQALRGKGKKYLGDW